MKEKEQTPESITKKYISHFLFAFAAFDGIHLVCAIALIIVAYLAHPVNAMEGAECTVEIVFSLLLISFINAMHRHHDSVDHPQVTYTLGYLTASASLFVPLSFSLPEIIEGEWQGSRSIALGLVSGTILIAFLAFACLFIALSLNKKEKVWLTFVIIGLSLMIALVPVQLASEFYIREDPIVLVFHIIKCLAPWAFAPIGITLVARKKSRSLFFRKDN